MAEEKIEITIVVEGGLIADVNIPENAPHVLITVKDYDIAGTEEDKLKEDEYGSYTESQYGNIKT